MFIWQIFVTIDLERLRMQKQTDDKEVVDLSHFLNEYNKESDRGAVLIAASRLDEVLKGLLNAFLRKTKTAKELIDGFNAPLGTFSARINACHALGLIEEQEYNEINIIRKIRNQFGHQWKNVSFETQSISAHMENIDWYGPDEVMQTPRAKFNFLVAILLRDLLWRERLVKKCKVPDRTWPNKTR